MRLPRHKRGRSANPQKHEIRAKSKGAAMKEEEFEDDDWDDDDWEEDEE
jgi:hypothetical protein